MRNLWEELIQLSLAIGKDEMGTLSARFPTTETLWLTNFKRLGITTGNLCSAGRSYTRVSASLLVPLNVIYVIVFYLALRFSEIALRTQLFSFRIYICLNTLHYTAMENTTEWQLIATGC
jgi:hypothetical protein